MRPSYDLQPSVKLLIDGEFRESQATDWVDVTNPVRGPPQALVIVRHDEFTIDYVSLNISCCKGTIWSLPTSLAQATQEVVSRLPQTTEREFNAAVQAAKDAFPKWRNTALPTRSRAMFKFQELIRQHMVCFHAH